MVGERLAELREQKALTLRDLEEASGVGADAISKIENGHRKPRPSTLRKLARALGVEVEDFFREPALPLAEAPRGAEQPERERSALEAAREAVYAQYELDLKARNRLEESEIQQTYFARVHDEALHGDLKYRPPDELADALLEESRARLLLEQENARLREKNAELRAERAGVGNS
jgi:transcriptional regulator with XRE-family HTH domain